MSAAPIACRTWCVEGDGHVAESDIDDQRCESEPVVIGQSLVPKWRDSEGGWNEQVVDVKAHAGPHYPAQVVLYAYGDIIDGLELRFTPAEARDLAKAIYIAATLASTK